MRHTFVLGMNLRGSAKDLCSYKQAKDKREELRVHLGCGECRLLVWWPALIDVGMLIKNVQWSSETLLKISCSTVIVVLLNTAISVIHLIQGHVRDCLGFKRPLAGIGAQRCTRIESRRRSDVSQQSDSYLNWRIWSQPRDREKFVWFCYTTGRNSNFD